MKKNLFALLLLVGVVLTSCSKDTPAVTDARDKFVGTWSGNSNFYESGTFAFNSTYSYTITKDAISSNKIIINDISNGIINCRATVNGSSYTISNYSDSDGSYSFLLNGNGTLIGNSIVENGTYKLTNLSTGNVLNFTYTTNLSK
jgi:hypothetical protein